MLNSFMFLHIFFFQLVIHMFVFYICVCRLGEAEKAIYHFKHAGPESDPEDMAKAHSLQAHLSKCTEARRLRDWNTLVKEAGYTISAGADSAPQVSHLRFQSFPISRIGLIYVDQAMGIHSLTWVLFGCCHHPIKIYTLQAEALLKLHRHQEADAVLAASPYFSVDDCTKFFGPYGNANLLMIRAQVDLAAGRLVLLDRHHSFSYYKGHVLLGNPN